MKSFKSFIGCLFLTCVMCGSAYPNNPTYLINSVSHVLGNSYNNMRGLCFTLGVTVDNYQGKDVFACGKLCYKDNNGAWKDVPFSNTVSSNYECAGNVAMAIAKTNLSCCCQSSTTSKYELFLPYDAITHPSGNVDYKIVFWIRDAKDAGKFLGNKNGGYYHDYYFSLNWPGEWPKGQTKVPATKATSNSKSTVQDPAEKAFIQDLIRTLNDDSRTLEYDEYVSTPHVFLEGKNIIFNFIVNEDMLKGIPMKELFQSADYNEAYLNKLLQDTFLSEGMSAEERADYLKLKKYGYKLYYRFIGSSSGEVINYQIDYESILK